MERIVDSAKSTWYQGGYRANIVTYTISKLFHEARSIDKEIDLDLIWLKQELPFDLLKYLEKIAIALQSVILEPPPGEKNVGEWCKKELCWKSVSNLEVASIEEINTFLVGADEFKARTRDGVAEGAIDDSISIQGKVLELTSSGYFMKLYYWSDFTSHFSPLDKALVLKASTLQSFMKIPSEKDWKRLLEIRSRAEDEGFRVSGSPPSKLF